MKVRDGVPESEQIRRALKAWFRKHNIAVVEADRQRAQTRRRS